MKRGITRREREVTDLNEIIGILDRAKIVHIGMIDGNMPYVIPMNYGYTMEDGKLTLYLHSAVRGKKLDMIQANSKVFFEIDCDRMPFEGRVPCQYGMVYSSIMGRGTATLVDDVEAKKQAMTILMKTQTGKDFFFNDRLVSIVTVIRIDVSEYTAKHRPLPEAMR